MSAASPQHRKSVCQRYSFVSSTHRGPAFDLSQDLRRDYTVLSFHTEGTQHMDHENIPEFLDQLGRVRRRNLIGSGEAQTTDRHHTLDNRATTILECFKGIWS